MLIGPAAFVSKHARSSWEFPSGQLLSPTLETGLWAEIEETGCNPVHFCSSHGIRSGSVVRCGGLGWLGQTLQVPEDDLETCIPQGYAAPSASMAGAMDHIPFQPDHSASGQATEPRRATMQDSLLTCRGQGARRMPRTPTLTPCSPPVTRHLKQPFQYDRGLCGQELDSEQQGWLVSAL
jgi:hypothetical protein